MRPKLSQDMWVILAIVAFLLTFGLYAAKKETSDAGMEFFVRRTTYSAKRHGLKAIYETLGELGYPVRRVMHPFTMPLEDGVLFVVQPEKPITSQEWESIHKWVERGNTLIIARDTAFFPEPAETIKTVKSTACGPSFLAHGVKYYRTESTARIGETSWSFGEDCNISSGFG